MDCPKFDEDRRREEQLLLDLAVEAAKRHHRGHLTLMRFTTHWKGCYGTVDLDTGAGRDQIGRLPAYDCLYHLLSDLCHQAYHDERP
jgi:hypothetical protein